MRRGTFGFDVNFEPHVARHGVEEIEVEELFRGQLFIRRVRDTYTVLGSTATGRRLFVVVARRERGIVRPITAREMTAMERRLFERKAR
ncbi:MAG: BrnT family toxin [Planctomycetes bacterium]|nr:BrnT family toxin [Planctomycetota bacterium]